MFGLELNVLVSDGIIENKKYTYRAIIESRIILP